MTRNFILTIIVFLLSAAIFYVTVTQLDPLGEQQNIAFFTFFLSAFFGIASFFTLFFFFLAELISRRSLGLRYFFPAMRRGGLLATLVVVLLFLQFFRMLGILEAALLIIFLVLLEAIFISMGKRQ